MWYRPKQGRFHGELNLEDVKKEFKTRHHAKFVYDDVSNQWDICSLFDKDRDPHQDSTQFERQLQEIPAMPAPLLTPPTLPEVGRSVMHQNAIGQDVLFSTSLEDVLNNHCGLLSMEDEIWSASDFIQVEESQLVDMHTVLKFEVQQVKDKSLPGYLFLPVIKKYTCTRNLFLAHATSMVQCIREQWGLSLEDVILCLFEQDMFANSSHTLIYNTLSEHQIDILCGIYHVDTNRGAQTTTVVWWPNPQLWETSELHCLPPRSGGPISSITNTRVRKFAAIWTKNVDCWSEPYTYITWSYIELTIMTWRAAIPFPNTSLSFSLSTDNSDTFRMATARMMSMHIIDREGVWMVKSSNTVIVSPYCPRERNSVTLEMPSMPKKCCATSSLPVLRRKNVTSVMSKRMYIRLRMSPMMLVTMCIPSCTGEDECRLPIKHLQEQLLHMYKDIERLEADAKCKDSYIQDCEELVDQGTLYKNTMTTSLFASLGCSKRCCLDRRPVDRTLQHSTLAPQYINPLEEPNKSIEIGNYIMVNIGDLIESEHDHQLVKVPIQFVMKTRNADLNSSTISPLMIVLLLCMVNLT
ncbi:hypothetical protein DEU56DRAFT_758992 [Suillus clintonianus]|uniref:uncharacterized protein n=1 Tax=Suillus clintonianus TaxID=1904413 RepID=UPI001B881ED1|nr:uncharacterized protein DEU56DRAFT_758992 [Suillus clintonianus]KAG2126018.1 hypothetical protein DEU56DRAFT_758992 [Suillus clintonianus]